MLKKLGLGLVGLAFSAGLAFAAGAFDGFPIVGDTTGTTKCLSYGNNNVCNQYSPAGPATVTPGSLMPADTGANNQPFTILVPAVLTGAVVQTASPLTGTSIAATAGVSKLVLTPAGTIAALTVTLPAFASLVNGQEFFIHTSQTVTALTVTAGSGTTLVPTITTVTAAAPVKLIFIQTTATAGVWQLF